MSRTAGASATESARSALLKLSVLGLLISGQDGIQGGFSRRSRLYFLCGKAADLGCQGGNGGGVLDFYGSLQGFVCRLH